MGWPKYERLAAPDSVWLPHYSQTVHWAYKVRYPHLLHDLNAVTANQEATKTLSKFKKNCLSQHFSCSHFDLNFFFRVQIMQGEKILTDSGNIYNTALTGGRLGMFVFGQHDVIWSRLEVRCSDRYATLIGWFPHRNKSKDTIGHLKIWHFPRQFMRQFIRLS